MIKVKKALKHPLLSFVSTSYVIFFVFFIFIGISMIFGAPSSITNLLQIISAWSSTFAFVILFRKIYPGLKLKDFVKDQFSPKIRFSSLSTMVIIQVMIIAVTLFLLTITNDTQKLTLSFAGLGLLFFAFLDNLVRGPLGEELGWRGYALNELQKKYSPLKSALLVGVLWGFWHTPLWFVSGYTAVNLIKYIVLFMIGIISFSIIMTLFYNLNKNLMIPIISHQLFNFSLVLIKGELLDILVYVMLAYFAFAIILIIINPKEILYKKT
ncbi:CPBP family intramembrane metalloprotease [Virgibacillus sp. AGTR]|uniref:CPBP family intramembrane glutamic endopeptidase n=1 Tax=unclassified Virgibacillus TaxID=2620237 RepID=UPI001D05BB44|nr:MULTISPECIES: type II CAAX endopeptidase family protein [unclassified Virgibacillus]MCC2249512.1 CPBP family intramembrane metalloprotease [Virgibacillus sp. AGTR]